MVMAAVAVLAGSARLVACTVTTAGMGRNRGAVKRPPEVMVPTVLLPPGTPATLQLTAVLVVFETVASKTVVAPSSTGMLAGERLMEMSGGGGGGGAVELDPATPPHPAANADHAITKTIMQRIFRSAGGGCRRLQDMTCDNARCLPAADKICQRRRRREDGLAPPRGLRINPIELLS